MFIKYLSNANFAWNSSCLSDWCARKAVKSNCLTKFGILDPHRENLYKGEADNPILNTVLPQDIF